tara:strand:+ start:24693 stop:24956 length:264 start_codon:yes stop_codon:yes gene_type:complete
MSVVSVLNARFYFREPREKITFAYKGGIIFKVIIIRGKCGGLYIEIVFGLMAYPSKYKQMQTALTIALITVIKLDLTSLPARIPLHK